MGDSTILARVLTTNRFTSVCNTSTGRGYVFRADLRRFWRESTAFSTRRRGEIRISKVTSLLMTPGTTVRRPSISPR